MRIIIMALAAFFLSLASADGQELTIAVSPHLSADQRQDQGEAILRFLANEVGRGETAQIINAYDLVPIATFSVPDNRAYENPRAKIAVNREAVAALLTLEPTFHRAPGDVEFPINLPGLLRYLAARSGTSGDLIIIGSPLYDMPLEAHLSMASGGVPGDGLIRATRGISPFGASGEGQSLQGVRVHFAAIDQGWALHDRHAFAVERFTTLLIEAFGAELVTFAGDMETVFSQLRDGATAPNHGFVLEDTDKREILYFRADTAPRALLRDMSDGAASYTGPSRVDGEIEIGLFWPCQSCDFDLHVRPEAGAAVLSYLNHRSPEGRFYKDIRHGADDDRSLEVIVLDGPVDLSALGVWVNFYGGNVQSYGRAELRITIAGHTYVRPVEITARAGDGGAGRAEVIENSAADMAWSTINLLALLRGRDE
jgi:hypothetical protein